MMNNVPPAMKSNKATRAVMRQKAQAMSTHPDTHISALADFIDILIDDIEMMLAHGAWKDESVH